MNTDQLYDLLHQEPFRPFRIVLKDGTVHEIHYPRINLLGVDYIWIGKPHPSDPEWVYDTMSFARAEDIDRVEMLPNGQPAPIQH